MGDFRKLSARIIAITAIAALFVVMASGVASAEHCNSYERHIFTGNYSTASHVFYNSSGVYGTIQNIQNHLSSTCALFEPGNYRTVQINNPTAQSQIEVGIAQYRVDATTYDYEIFTEIETPFDDGIISFFPKPCSINPRVGTSTWKIYLGQPDGDWSLQLNCNDGTGWHTVNEYLDVGFANGRSLSEVSVNNQDGAADNVSTGLHYRLLDNVSWKAWINVHCWLDDNLLWHPQADSANSWHSVYDGGNPVQNC